MPIPQNSITIDRDEHNPIYQREMQFNEFTLRNNRSLSNTSMQTREQPRWNYKNNSNFNNFNMLHNNNDNNNNNPNPNNVPKINPNMLPNNINSIQQSMELDLPTKNMHYSLISQTTAAPTTATNR